MNGDSSLPLQKQNGNALPVSEEAPANDQKQLADLTIEELTAEVYQFHRKVIDCQKQALQYARQAGIRLILLKSKYEHGDWTDYLQEDFPDSPETARGYMRVARHWHKIAFYTYPSTRLSLRQALRFIAEERGKVKKESPATLRKEALNGFANELKRWIASEVRYLAENQEAVWAVLRKEVGRLASEAVTDTEVEEDEPTLEHHANPPTIIRPTLREGLARSATHANHIPPA